MALDEGYRTPTAHRRRRRRPSGPPDPVSLALTGRDRPQGRPDAGRFKPFLSEKFSTGDDSDVATPHRFSRQMGDMAGSREEISRSFQRARAQTAIQGEGPKESISELGDIGLARQGHIREADDPYNDEQHERDWNQRWIETYDEVSSVLSGQGNERQVRQAIDDLLEDVQIHQQVLNDPQKLNQIWGKQTKQGIAFHKNWIRRYEGVIAEIERTRGQGRV